MLKVKTSDDKLIEIGHNVIQRSKTLSDVFHNSKGDSNAIYSLATINSNAVYLIIEWCEHHKDVPIPAEEQCEWEFTDFDKNFFESLVDGEAFQVVTASSILDMKSLMGAGCKYIANLAKGKSPDELRLVYGIPTDSDDDEQHSIRMQ
ncbi:hypothetical protein GCK72_001277 [Caenorhabditis remanei]|uniref:Skp1-related protein n=1 Tax=Caenorhabditis remanei TaxID=31234 RepID=E3LXG2_CAERE|nr:hypothetical protein GCK72_001277 [Caenorhabditis remanei]EFO84760.1 hypothetical protein CRE_03649 [Caenorhabditis remanei]KAF1769460.1 hypothetical protein GCK72_001277 [Caenorhabditis remanei]